MPNSVAEKEKLLASEELFPISLLDRLPLLKEEGAGKGKGRGRGRGRGRFRGDAQVGMKNSKYASSTDTGSTRSAPLAL